MLFLLAQRGEEHTKWYPQDDGVITPDARDEWSVSACPGYRGGTLEEEVGGATRYEVVSLPAVYLADFIAAAGTNHSRLLPPGTQRVSNSIVVALVAPTTDDRCEST